MSAIHATNPDLIRQALYGDFNADQKQMFDRCLAASKHTWALVHNGELLCVWGMCTGSLASQWAHIWLYRAEAAEAHEFVFIRQSQIAIKEMLKICPTLVGYLPQDWDPQSRKWLSWLGAKFEESRGSVTPYIIGGHSG